MERGIITPAVVMKTEGDTICGTSRMPADKLRYYALYWDKLVVTESKLFGSALSAEQQLLESAGILRKERAQMKVAGTFGGAEMFKMYFQGLAQVASELTDKNPGQWAIHPSGDQLIIPEGLSTELVTADFELSRALPLPKADFPLEKLLEFKLQRKDELDALRMVLDDLYLEISNSGDIPRSKIAQIQRLERAISDLDKVAQQSWGERVLASRRVSIDLNQGPVVNGIAVGGAVTALSGSPIGGMIAGVSATVLSSFKFEASITKQLTSACGKQADLSYLSEIKNNAISD